MTKRLVLAALMLSVATPALAFEPQRPVEFVVTSGAGGGTDIFARTVQSIIATHDLMDASVIVSNKGGGSGAEGFAYGAAASGDPHKLIFGTNNAYLLPSVARVPFQAEDLTPVAGMALDEFLIWVNGQSEFNEAGPFIEAVKADPAAMQFGGSQSRDTDQILVSMIGEATGAELRYIPFNGGGEALTQLAGNHIAANVNNPNENRGQWEAGLVKPLCVFRAERLPESELVHDGMGWHDIPTCQEAGVPITDYQMPRTVWLPGDVDEEVVAFYRDVLERVTQTPEWEAYVTNTAQSAAFMAGEEFQTYAATNKAEIEAVLQREGWLVQ